MANPSARLGTLLLCIVDATSRINDNLHLDIAPPEGDLQYVQGQLNRIEEWTKEAQALVTSAIKESK